LGSVLPRWFGWLSRCGSQRAAWRFGSCSFKEANLRDVEREHADCDIVEEVFHSEGWSLIPTHPRRSVENLRNITS